LRGQLAIASVALLLAVIAATTARGSEDIGYVNSEQIRIEYKGSRDIESQLDASVEDWKAQAREMESEIEAMLVELQSQRLLLSDEAAREKEQAIQERQFAYETFLNQIWGVNGLAARREAELWQPVFDRINEILQEIGTEGDYKMIFDAAHMGIVYADPATDLTQQILDRLNGEGN
jgi:outer membrane protein